jgi:hypothetical protein
MFQVNEQLYLYGLEFETQIFRIIFMMCQNINFINQRSNSSNPFATDQLLVTITENCYDLVGLLLLSKQQIDLITHLEQTSLKAS